MPTLIEAYFHKDAPDSWALCFYKDSIGRRYWMMQEIFMDPPTKMRVYADVAQHKLENGYYVEGKSDHEIFVVESGKRPHLVQRYEHITRK